MTEAKSTQPVEEVVAAQMYMPEVCANRRELQLQVYRIGCNGESTVEVISHADLLRYLNQRRQSTQPQSPPTEREMNTRLLARVLLLEAENKSLKAHSEQYRQNWLAILRELGCECHLDALELIARIKAERDKAASEANQLRLAFVLSDSILPAEFEPELPPTKRLHTYIDKLLEVVREFYEHTGIIDNGKCAVCRHGYRSWKLPNCRVPSGPCSNEDCLSRRADALRPKEEV